MAPNIRSLLTCLDELPSLRQPHDILSCVDRHIAQKANLMLMAAWQLAPDPYKPDAYVINRNAFLHREGAPPEFWEEFFATRKQHGPPILVRLAQRLRRSFTHTEAMRMAQPKGTDRWIFDLHRKHGFRDGLIVPASENWFVSFASHKVVNLPLRERVSIGVAANYATAHLEELLMKGKTKRVGRVALSMRERSVLHGLSRGHGTKQIATDLQLTQASVHTFMQRAKRKLGAKTPTHAVVIAMRGNIL